MKNTMEYKGYLGSVEFDEEEGLLFGRVMGIRSLISYEGESAKELLEDFHGAVDDYLELQRPHLAGPAQAAGRLCDGTQCLPQPLRGAGTGKGAGAEITGTLILFCPPPVRWGRIFLCKRGGLLKSASTGWFCLLSAAGAQGILLP